MTTAEFKTGQQRLEEKFARNCLRFAVIASAFAASTLVFLLKAF